MFRTHFSRLVATVLASIGLVLQPAGADTSAAPAELPFLHAQGDRLADSENQRVLLKGCNLGNWLMIESWMLGGCLQATDQAQIFSALQQRFGEEKADHLIHLYREGYITERDFVLIKSFGFNVVRVPFDYRILQSDQAPYAIRPDGFFWLDKALEMAERAGVYVILDLHGAPGGQSKEMHTGQAAQNHLWDNQTDLDRTVALWRAIAQRYRNRGVVAAYDLLNEPYGNYHQDLRPDLVKLVSRLYTTIRQVDPKHIIFAPGALNGGVEFYGNPHENNWQNVGFTEHYYPGLFGDKPALESHARTLNREMPAKFATMHQWGVPYYVGEFNVVLDANGGFRVMRAYYDFFAKTGWSATMWSYKLLKPAAGAGPDAWYMVTNAESLPRLDLQSSSYEDFEKFFASFGTMKLAVNERLRQALTDPNPQQLALGTYPSPVAAAPRTDANVFKQGALAGYEATDIGGAKRGAVEINPDGTIKVWAAGSDIFSTADSFRFISKLSHGNGELAARVLSLDETDQWAKAGLMARWGESPSASFALINTFPDGTVAFAARQQPGGTTTESKRLAGLPIDLKITIKDGKATGYYRLPAGDWQQLGSSDVRGESEYQLGLAATSHAPSSFTTAVFQLGQLPAATPPALNRAKELLINNSFESASGWSRWGDAINRQTNPALARTGNASMLCGKSGNYSGLWQEISVIPGERYTFTIWATRDQVSADDAGSIELRLECTDGDHQVTLNSGTFSVADLSSKGQWLPLRVSATAMNNRLRALVIYNPESSASLVHLDDASLVSQGDH